MVAGYMGKLLFVNLSTGEIEEETPEEAFYGDFIGGYGIGARILYSRQKGGVDPLGPDNILGLITGPLTGSPAIGGSRYEAVAKSPLTGGWGDANVAITEKMVKREGFGDILADGVRLAAERIGNGAEVFAVHSGGQEMGMHDPKLDNAPGLGGKAAAAMYKMDATPGRHTQDFGPHGFLNHLNNALGTCQILFLWPTARGPYVQRVVNAVTGLERSMEELLKAGERIANLRHVFTLREGINPLERFIHPRIVGRPPQKEGPLTGVSPDLEAQTYWCLGALDWDRITTKPSKSKLLELGLDDIAEELWPPEDTTLYKPPWAD